ncbi:tetratricopeptide repeat protein [Roseobacter sinensis]|uniref:Tetratricopeptide repeat protein n=1 Tax=Roseobacter sinensis TaxID=2931391 RepID=A0ABT3BKP8_9RHOB|nr:tetratricopeptide repeat protein [Roseobacter sp. WL0113]MCV3273803.1 tetratricopeptide repeat protein [Roseobacter sp. WL0113]
MSIKSVFTKTTAMVLFCLFLAACESSEEKAQGHYETGLELIAEGDDQRATLEFRNALQLVPTMLEARRELAKLYLKSDDTFRAFREFLRVAEQDPEDAEVQLVLAQLSFLENRWDIFDRHSGKAVELDPDNPEVQIIALAGQYRNAAMEEDGPAIRSIITTAETMQDTSPDSAILRQILIDGYIRESRLEAALTQIAQALEADPDDRRFYTVQAQVQGRLGDMDALESTLSTMVERFPDDPQLRTQYLQFLVSQGKTDAAEDFLRVQAENAAQDDAADVTTLVQFILQVRGNEAALAELDSQLEQNPDNPILQSLRASLQFDMGERAEAVAQMERIIGTFPQDEMTDAEADALERIKTTLATMLIANGNEVGARRTVEEILARNANAAGALKMQATWMIADDDTDGAITALRTALAEEPEDVQAMTLMASAYQRAGNNELMMDFLSLAAEASNYASQPSLRYATALAQRGNLDQAEETLLQSLRIQPNNMDVLIALGQVYLEQDDAGRTTQVIETLRRLGSAEADRAATALDVSQRVRNNGIDEAVAYLEQLSQQDETLKVPLIRAHLQANEPDKAMAIVAGILEDDPSNASMRYLQASIQMATGQTEEARAGLTGLVEDQPGMAQAWIQLVNLSLQDRQSDAEVLSLIDTALTSTDQNVNLLWIKASVLERGGDPEGAIAIYEALYERDSSSVIIANNLASLLSTVRTDEASLQRAVAIAQRLKDADIPALQDTYGWLLYRTGNIEDSVPYLEKAAQGLPNDGRVQYHLGMAYHGVGRTEEALAQMQKAIDVIGPIGDSELLEEIKAQVQEIQAGPADN